MESTTNVQRSGTRIVSKQAAHNENGNATDWTVNGDRHKDTYNQAALPMESTTNVQRSGTRIVSKQAAHNENGNATDWTVNGDRHKDTYNQAALPMELATNVQRTRTRIVSISDDYDTSTDSIIDEDVIEEEYFSENEDDRDFSSFKETKRALAASLIMEKRNNTIQKCNQEGTLRDHNEMDDKQRRAIHGIWNSSNRID